MPLSNRRPSLPSTNLSGNCNVLTKSYVSAQIFPRMRCVPRESNTCPIVMESSAQRKVGHAAKENAAPSKNEPCGSCRSPRLRRRFSAKRVKNDAESLTTPSITSPNNINTGPSALRVKTTTGMATCASCKPNRIAAPPARLIDDLAEQIGERRGHHARGFANVARDERKHGNIR